MKNIRVACLAFALIAIFAVKSEAAVDCFIAKEGEKTLVQQGNCATRYAPNSTFKIPLAVMGYDAGILVDDGAPSWKRHWIGDAVTPQIWIKNSVVWYSQRLTKQLGLQKFAGYVQNFDYGNMDVSGDFGKNNGLSNAWLSSSLKISPLEQIEFLDKLVNNCLPASEASQVIARKLMYIEDIDGWQFYGKTGTGIITGAVTGIDQSTYLQEGYFVGFLVKNDREGERVARFAIHVTEPNQVKDGKNVLFAGKLAKNLAKSLLRERVMGSTRN